MNKGRAEEATNRPIKVLIGTAIMVEMNPVMAAAIPAIWPKGSMASARRFPKRKPIAKNCKAKKASRTSTPGFSLPKKKITYSNEIIKKAIRAMVISRSIPNFTTKVPFRNMAVPMAMASPAKM